MPQPLGIRPMALPMALMSLFAIRSAPQNPLVREPLFEPG
jgi:hypothetical protein